jgi:glucose/mannose-6-phosphate isomerase
VTPPDSAAVEGNSRHRVDSLGLWEATVSLPEQIEGAVQQSAESLDALVRPTSADVGNIVVLGMGASGLAGDVVAAVASPIAPVPVTVVKSYDAPHFIDRSSLVIAISYSGETAETLRAVDVALNQGAQVTVVTSGGALMERARSDDLALVPLSATIPQARAALGAMVAAPMMLLDHLGLLPGVGDRLRAVVPALQGRRDQLVDPASPTLGVARQIGRTFPIIHGAVGLGALSAQRWKSAVNENAKSPAFSAAQPELCHGDVAGWGQSGDVTRQILTLVTLRRVNESAQMARRFELVAQLLDEVMASMIEVHAQCADDLAAFFELSLFGDLVSMHLAAVEGTDPGPIPAVTDIKHSLASG